MGPGVAGELGKVLPESEWGLGLDGIGTQGKKEALTKWGLPGTP